MKLNQMTGVAAVLVACGMQARADIQYPYQFNYLASSGQCDGVLYLDQPSSEDGTIADISPASCVYLDGQQIFLNNLSLGSANDTFTWDASGITEPFSLLITVYMQRVPADNQCGFIDNLLSDSVQVCFGTPGTGSSGSGVQMYVYDNMTDVGGGFYSGTGPDSAGQWAAEGSPVPEPGQLVAGLVLCVALGRTLVKQKFFRLRREVEPLIPANPR